MPKLQFGKYSNNNVLTIFCQFMHDIIVQIYSPGQAVTVITIYFYPVILKSRPDNTLNKVVFQGRYL